MSREPTPEPAPVDGKTTDEKPAKDISRREFARRAAMASAVASWAPVNAAPITAAITASLPAKQVQQPPANLPKLAPESQAEVEARVQAIVSQYGERFSDEQKADLRRLCTVVQPSLDRLRAYAVANGDGPALYLKPLV